MRFPASTPCSPNSISYPPWSTLTSFFLEARPWASNMVGSLSLSSLITFSVAKSWRQKAASSYLGHFLRGSPLPPHHHPSLGREKWGPTFFSLSSRRPLHGTGGKYMVHWIKEGKCRVVCSILHLQAYSWKKTIVYYDVIWALDSAGIWY